MNGFFWGGRDFWKSYDAVHAPIFLLGVHTRGDELPRIVFPASVGGSNPFRRPFFFLFRCLRVSVVSSSRDILRIRSFEETSEAVN